MLHPSNNIEITGRNLLLIPKQEHREQLFPADWHTASLQYANLLEEEAFTAEHALAQEGCEAVSCRFKKRTSTSCRTYSSYGGPGRASGGRAHEGNESRNSQIAGTNALAIQGRCILHKQAVVRQIPATGQERQLQLKQSVDTPCMGPKCGRG